MQSACCKQQTIFKGSMKKCVGVRESLRGGVGGGVGGVGKCGGRCGKVCWGVWEVWG